MKASVDGISSGVEKEEKITFLKGEARFTGEKVITVNAQEVTADEIYLLANFTSDNITGTSTKTPTTVTIAAGDFNPKRAIATATANSKKLLAPIIAAGEQMA